MHTASGGSKVLFSSNMHVINHAYCRVHVARAALLYCTGQHGSRVEALPSRDADAAQCRGGTAAAAANLLDSLGIHPVNRLLNQSLKVENKFDY